MKFAPLFVGTMMAVGWSSQAQAQALLDGNSVDEILTIARYYGDATLDQQSNGDPQIRGSIDGIGYSIYFRNCTANQNCEDVNFYSGILDNTAALETINQWNQTRRFGKAYLDGDGDTVVEMDVNLENGVSAESMEATLGVWQIVLNEFAHHVGFDPAAAEDDAESE